MHKRFDERIELLSQKRGVVLKSLHEVFSDIRQTPLTIKEAESILSLRDNS